MADRVEEYIRRMKARGYEPTLMGMDDDDIEWELSKMEEADRRREAEQQPMRTMYRPVDPGLKARILRMFGQPYDESAIPKGQEFYLNGWDNGDDDGTLAGKNSWVEPAPPRNGAGGTVWDDPWAKAWKLDWGVDGAPAGKAKTMEYRWGRDGAGLTSRGGGRNALGDGLAGVEAASGMQEANYNASGGGEGEVKKAGGWDKVIGAGGGAIENVVAANEFADEVEKEALRQHPDRPELAKKKAQDAKWKYYGYLAGVAATAFALASRAPKGKVSITTGVGTAGTVAGAYAVKPLIKKHVLGKSEADYESEIEEEKPLYGGD